MGIPLILKCLSLEINFCGKIEGFLRFLELIEVIHNLVEH